ncbi:hypothetical protein RRG08_012290 [Elysia crispata]|uniref:Uncharacterized protein n=1 Tax=Elysia crispata TaxID=231223 RepID=A0AAE1BCG1_9GAST|nr:hypothetical protein RRG08_012290 [Elysia crispata]
MKPPSLVHSQNDGPNYPWKEVGYHKDGVGSLLGSEDPVIPGHLWLPETGALDTRPGAASGLSCNSSNLNTVASELSVSTTRVSGELISASVAAHSLTVSFANSSLPGPETALSLEVGECNSWERKGQLSLECLLQSSLGVFSLVFANAIEQVLVKRSIAQYQYHHSEVIHRGPNRLKPYIGALSRPSVLSQDHRQPVTLPRDDKINQHSHFTWLSGRLYRLPTCIIYTCCRILQVAGYEDKSAGIVGGAGYVRQDKTVRTYELLDMKTRVRGLWVRLDMSAKTRQ